MEGPHGQLCTRLTNRLSCYHTNRFAHVDLMAATEVSSIASRADAVTGVTSDWRSNKYLVDTHLLDALNPQLVNQCTLGQCYLIGTWLHHVRGYDTSEDTISKRFNDVTTVDDRRHQQAFFSTAVLFDNYYVLRHVNQSTGQVTRVGRLESRISKTLTSAVSGDEVLEYVQTLTEVRSDRCFDNRAVWLCHQSTHTSQLTDLCGGASSTRIGIHVYRVE